MRVSKTLFIVIILAFPILLYIPIIRDWLSFSLNKYYFIITSVILGVLIVYKESRRIPLKNFWDLIFCLLLLCLSLFSNFDKVTFPPIFFAILSILIIGFNQLTEGRPKTFFIWFSIGYLILSVVSLLNPSNFQNSGRFSGIGISASVFSCYLTAFFILYYFNSKFRRSGVVFFYALSLLLIFYTQTRLNLLYFLALPFIFWLSTHTRFRWIYLMVFLFMLNAAYPIYRILNKDSFITTMRYDDGKDPSFQLRYELFERVLLEYRELTVIQKFFGVGSERAREVILANFNYDHMPHNDFVRILYDFGIIGVLLFLILFIKIGSRSEILFCLTTLYFLSFYHNMVYNLFIVSLIFLHTVNKNEES